MKCSYHKSSYTVNDLWNIWKRKLNELKRNRKIQPTKDDNKLKDKDYRRQADFEQENDEEISGEDEMFSRSHRQRNYLMAYYTGCLLCPVNVDLGVL